jgi:hypothetical protein
VSRIRPGMRLLGGVRGLLFHEVLFVRAARAYGLGGHFKAGQRWTDQNRPKEQTLKPGLL